MGAAPSVVQETPSLSLRTSALAFLVVAILVFPVVLGLGMTRGLNHDEHQHIAAGALIAREGLVPYRDFPHFHTPYLPFAYAILFRATDHLLTAARMISVVCSVAILGMIGGTAYGLFARYGKLLSSLICAGSVLLALTTTLFTETAGRAWNHEPSLLLVLLAVVAQVLAMKSTRTPWFVAPGLLLGLAIGTRITYAPLAAPFGLAALSFPILREWRWKCLAAFGAGLAIGLAGLLWLAVLVPEQVLFDNIGFAKANIDYRFSTGEPRTMTLGTKIRYFFKGIVRPDAALFIAGLFPVVTAFLINFRTGRRLPLELLFLLFLLPFVLIGSFAPSPAFDQYFFPLIPFLSLAGLYAFISIPRSNVWFGRIWRIGAVAAIVSVIVGYRGFDDIEDYLVFRKWEGTRLHRRAMEIKSYVPDGRILTLAPVYPLEAGLSIYPAFSTGPFAWRVSSFIEPAKSARLGIVSPATLGQMLAGQPASGILVGFEEDGEKPFNEFARRNGARRQSLEDDHQLWVTEQR